MRKFIKENSVISVLLLVSLFIVIKYSEIPYPFAFLQNFDWLFCRPQMGTWGFDFWRLLENLSLAYIASFIFFLVIDYFPKKKQSKAAFTVVSGDLVNLYLYMSTIISVYKHFCSIAKEDKEINLSDLSELPQLQINENVYHYKTTAIINGVEKETCVDNFNLQYDSTKYGKLIHFNS